MIVKIVAVLAEERRVADQKLRMIAAVRRMTVQAVFIDGRMLYHKRPSLFRMALIAEFVHRIGLDLVVGKGSMHIMTIGAFDQAFLEGMVGLPGELRPDILMAVKAQGRLLLLQKLFLLTVGIVTIGAGNVFTAVFA